MKALLVSLALLGLSGCAHVNWEYANTDEQPPFGFIVMGNGLGYVIDSRTETCLLASNSGLAHVSCAKLKKSTPEAARYITWETGEEASAPVPPPTP